MLTDPNYIISAGADMGVSLGALLEVILVVANIGTAVVLYPLVKRQNAIVALGYVTARVMEGAVIAVGMISLLSVVTLRQEFAGATDTDAAALVPVGRALVAVHEATFLLGLVGAEACLSVPIAKHRWHCGVPRASPPKSVPLPVRRHATQ